MQKRLAPLRALVWIILSGVFLGLAMLSKGPAPPATVLFPMAIWLMLHHRRASIYLGFPILWLIGVACLAAWALTIWKLYPASVVTWSNDLHKLATGRRTIGAEVDKALAG